MSNDIPEDEDLHIDLRGFDFTNKKKKKEEDDSLVIDDSSVVLDGPSLIIGDDIEISDDSLVIGEDVELTDAEDKTDITSGSVLLDSNFVIDEFTSNVSDSKNSSVFASDISDEGISLEGGLDIKDDGQVASWSVDLGDFYNEEDSLVGSNEETLLAGSDSIHDDEPASLLIEDSIYDSISGISDIKPEDILNIKKDQKVYKDKYPYEDHWNGFLLTVMIMLVGLMFVGCLLGLDLVIGLNCQEIGCNCGHPFIANAIYELLYGG